MSENKVDINQFFASEDERKKNTKTQSSGGAKFVFDSKIYFQPAFTKEETKANLDKKTFTIRILPPLNGETEFFMKRKYHKVETNVYDFNSKSIVKKEVTVNCGKQDGTKCALCDLGYQMYNEGVELVKSGETEKGESLKKASQQYYAKDAYVARVIDRDDEDYGVKFWSFDEFKKGGGIYDLLKTKAQRNGDYTDIEDGYDLILDKYKGQSIVIDSGKNSPLTTDEAKKTKWLSETRTARDIWKNKNHHEKYLEFVANEIPCIPDKTTGEWVEFEVRSAASKPAEPETKTLPINQPKAEVELPTQAPQPTETFTSKPAPVADDDLPF